MIAEEELLAAILEAPDDDGPRLVYADWLLEQDDEERRARGEYIQLACAIARCGDEPTPERARLVRRSMQLLGEHELRWVDDALAPWPYRRIDRAGAPVWEWSRGFVEAYRDPDGFQAQVPPYLRSIEEMRRTPLREVSLHADDTRFVALLRGRALRRLRAVSLHFLQNAASALAALCDSDAFVELRSLRIVSGMPLGVRPLLAAADRLFPSLERLELWIDMPDDALLDALASSPARRTVTALHVHAHAETFGARGAEAIAQLPYALRELGVRSTDANAMLAALARAGTFPELGSLSLRSERRRDEPWNLDAARAVLGARRIERLRLSGRYAKHDIEPLFAMPELATLRALDLSYNRLDDDTVDALSRAEHIELRELALAYDDVTNAGAKTLARAKNLRSLRRIDLRKNARIGVAPFTTSKSFADLEHLDLRDNSIPPNGAAVAKLKQRFGAAVIVGYDPEA